jgi:hypothetical protein
MLLPEAAAVLAGFVLAHAAWSISDLPQGESLVPLAIVQKGDERQLLRFEADTQAEAIAKGKATLKASQADVDAWAFARENTERTGETTRDVISVSVWAQGMEQPVIIVQHVNLAWPGPFRVVGEPVVIVGSERRDGNDAIVLLDQVKHGIQSHPRAGPLWDSWIAR